MPTQVATSSAATATAFSNQRKVDRCSNGVLWTIYWGGGSSMETRYSTDNGATWVIPVTQNFSLSLSNNYTPNISLFIDQDDYAHVAYKEKGDGYIYYRRGTPNAARTEWTWSGAEAVYAHSAFSLPDIVAHREGTGWKVHVVMQARLGSNTTDVYYESITITSAGAITVDGGSSSAALLFRSTSADFDAAPSIDFHHTGNGKTVKDGSPHLFVAYSGFFQYGIYFQKATYSSGSWTWGTYRAIDSARYIDTATKWLNCLFDGTRVLIAGSLHDGTTADTMLYERDVADTTTTTRLLNDNPSASLVLLYGSATYDSQGNVYLFGRNNDEAAGTYDLTYQKWTRTTNTLGAEVVVDSGVGDPYLSAKRGYSNNRIEFIYTDGTASPYNVTYDSIVANASPTITAGAPGTFDPRLIKRFSWTYSDAEANPQTQYEIGYRIAGSGSAYTTTTVASANAYHDYAANTFTDETDYEWQVRVHDGTSWSTYATSTFRADSWTYGAEVTSSTGSGTIDTTNFEAADYQVQVRTADAVGFGPWSASAVSVASRVAVMLAGAWKTVPRHIQVGGVWKRHDPRKQP